METTARKRRKLNDGLGAGFGVLEDLEEESVQEQAEETSDTVAAINLLRAEFPPSAKVIPIILRSQIYDIVKDRTEVDRALEDERTRGSLRMIKLPASIDEYAYIFTEDYRACIDIAKLEQRERGTAENLLEVFGWYQAILPKILDASILHTKLISLLQRARSKSGSKLVTLKDSELAPLLTAGLLTRDVSNQQQYLVAVAGAGRFITSITKGRKEIVSLLSRKRYKEAFAKDMHRWKLRGSTLDMRWHLRDLTGKGIVQMTNTPSGQMARLVKNA